MIGRRGRSLHWERGLKPRWDRSDDREACRSLHWERGLKHGLDLLCGDVYHRRSLHWERGLKLLCMIILS